MKTLVISLRVTLVTLLLTGIVYPLLVTAAARVLFPVQASGSTVADERGAIVGSALIGQRFLRPAYLHARPSAAGDGYDASASGGSNLGPTSVKLRDRATADLAALAALQPDAPPPPVELVSASASGLDPHLSPEAALHQVSRVAAARGVAPERVRSVIAARVEGRTLGFLGEPRVNVLLVNLALDRVFGRPSEARCGEPPQAR